MTATFWVISLVDAPLTPIYLAQGGYATTAKEAAQFQTQQGADEWLRATVAPADVDRWIVVHDAEVRS